MTPDPKPKDDLVDVILTDLTKHLPRGWPLSSNNPKDQLRWALESALEKIISPLHQTNHANLQIERFKQRIADLEQQLRQQKESTHS